MSTIKAAKVVIAMHGYYVPNTFAATELKRSHRLPAIQAILCKVTVYCHNNILPSQDRTDSQIELLTKDENLISQLQPLSKSYLCCLNQNRATLCTIDSKLTCCKVDIFPQFNNESVQLMLDVSRMC